MWPQFRTIHEKGVVILNSKECDKLYHKVSKIPSLVRVVDSRMICAEDLDREAFCYVSTSLLAPSPPGAPGMVQEWGGAQGSPAQWRGEGRGGWRGRWERKMGDEREEGAVGGRGLGAWHERGEMSPSEGGLLGLDLKGPSQLGDPWVGEREVVRGLPALSSSWGMSPSGHTRPP